MLSQMIITDKYLITVTTIFQIFITSFPSKNFALFMLTCTMLYQTFFVVSFKITINTLKRIILACRLHVWNNTCDCPLTHLLNMAPDICTANGCAPSREHTLFNESDWLSQLFVRLYIAIQVTRKRTGWGSLPQKPLGKPPLSQMADQNSLAPWGQLDGPSRSRL